MAVNRDEAQSIALDWLANDDWEPAIARVEDAGEDWRIFYNSRIFRETNSVSHALAGNLPLLVNKRTAAVAVDTEPRS